jgi:hypothetical protein
MNVRKCFDTLESLGHSLDPDSLLFRPALCRMVLTRTHLSQPPSSVGQAMIEVCSRLKARFFGKKAEASVQQPERQVVEIGYEAPIRTQSEDRLRRADYAGHIGDILSELSPREGRVFAIRGAWGFGKSSLSHLHRM